MKEKPRTERLKFRISPEERALIEQKMKIAGFENKSEYCRKMLINGFTINTDIPEIREILSELAHMGNNLKQLVQWAHETDSVYETEILELQQQHRQMLSAMECILNCLKRYQ